jgi:NADPH-dependent 2,4-dienoyl-CoA reductase/sulfur reductase-like enzyme/rhodanese-related sulfurtransferase
MIMRIVIVGGVAGGASAATRARRVNPDAEIIIFEKGSAISFANCGLPYHLGGEIKERSKLLVANADLFKRRFNINVKTRHEVLSIDREKKEITLHDLQKNEEYTEHYDILILSTGSELIRLPEIPYDAENVFTLWSLDDLDYLKDYFSKNNLRQISIIGAGFVGLEVVEQLRHIGMQVQLIELAPQVLGPLDPEMAKFIEEELIKHDVALHLNTKVEKVHTSENKVTTLSLASGVQLNTEAVLVGVGVRPLSGLAKKAELACSKNGAVQVNQFHQSSDESIYAVGDMSEYIFGPTNTPTTIPLAGPANRAGRIAGEHAGTGKTQFTQKAYGTSIVRVFNKTAGTTGLSEKLCKRSEIPYKVAYISAPHHASYFPGAKELIIKLLYSPSNGTLLGAQIVGEEGVDKRLDIISTVLHFGGTLQDLASLDFSYAPPFGSAKDPLHQVAFTGLNDLAESPPLISPFSSLEEMQIIDVRSEKERKEIPLEGALAIPIDGEPPFYENQKLNALDKNLETIVVCHSGKRAHIVASYLKKKGYLNVKNMTGGMMIRSRG